MIPDQPISLPPPQPRQFEIKWSRIFLAGFALWLIAWGSEVHFPDRGIFALIFGAPTELREHSVAGSILYGLLFTIS